jgi:hypothetical protein
VIAAATGQAYQTTAADVGTTLRVRVTATNANGSTGADSSATGVIASQPVVTPVPPVDPANLAPNPHLDEDPTAVGGGYQPNGTAAFSWATDQVHSPSHSLKIVSNEGGLTRWMTITNTIPVSAGTRYTISAFLKTSNVGGYVQLTATYWTSGLVYQGTAIDAPDNLTGSVDWTQTGLQTTAPQGAGYVRIEVRLHGVGTVWADDLFVGTDTPTPSQPPVVGSPPQNSLLPLTTGTPEQGQPLLASDGSWTGSPTSFADQWRRCDPSGATCVDIAGQTGRSYTPIAADVGQTLRVRVTATNAGGPSQPADSAATDIVRSPNLAPNPGFESDPASSYNTSGTGLFSWASDAAHSGSSALKLVSVTDTLTRWLTETQAIKVSPGTTYDVSAWLKTANVRQTAGLSINFWDANGAHLPATIDAPQQLTGTTDWTQLKMQVIAPVGAAYLRVEFRLTGLGTLWADDLYVGRHS